MFKAAVADVEHLLNITFIKAERFVIKKHKGSTKLLLLMNFKKGVYFMF